MSRSKTAAGMAFYWNYERELRRRQRSLNQTTSGATLRATGSGSDFTLLELNSRPTSAYNVYAGFNRSASPPASAVAIHHPTGAAKKISFENDPVEDGVDFSDGWGGTHWRIAGWDVGTTEGGSSGCPLFNPNHQIVGQLHGGTADCGGGWDEFGKLSSSWGTGLAGWLDPNCFGGDLAGRQGKQHLLGRLLPPPRLILRRQRAVLLQELPQEVQDLRLTPSPFHQRKSGTLRVPSSERKDPVLLLPSPRALGRRLGAQGPDQVLLSLGGEDEIRRSQIIQSQVDHSGRHPRAACVAACVEDVGDERIEVHRLDLGAELPVDRLDEGVGDVGRSRTRSVDAVIEKMPPVRNASRSPSTGTPLCATWRRRLLASTKAAFRCCATVRMMVLKALTRAEIVAISAADSTTESGSGVAPCRPGRSGCRSPAPAGRTPAAAPGRPRRAVRWDRSAAPGCHRSAPAGWSPD